MSYEQHPVWALGQDPSHYCLPHTMMSDNGKHEMSTQTSFDQTRSESSAGELGHLDEKLPTATTKQKLMRYETKVLLGSYYVKT